MHFRELSTFIGTKTPTTTVSVYISYSTRALDAWRTLRRELLVRSKDAHKQRARTSLSVFHEH